MNADCRRIRPLLDAFHDREMDEAAAGRVKEHLAACPDCRRELETLGHLDALVDRAGRPELAEDHWDWHRTRVWRRVREDARRRQPVRRPSFFWPRVATLAGGLVVVLVVILVGRQTLLPDGRPITQSESPVARVEPTTSESRSTAQSPVQHEEKPTTVAIKDRAAPEPSPATGIARKQEAPAAPAAAAGDAVPEPEEMLSAGEAGRPREPELSPVGRRAKTKTSGRSGRGRWVGGTGRAQPDVDIQPAGEATENEQAVVPRPPEPLERRQDSQPAEKKASAPPPPVQDEVAETSVPDAVTTPILPKLAIKERATVVVKLTTDNTGRVTGATISKSSGIMTADSAALEAARRSKFRPVQRSGRYIGSSFERTYQFEPARKSQD